MGDTCSEPDIVWISPGRAYFRKTKKENSTPYLNYKVYKTILDEINEYYSKLEGSEEHF